jgi:uncharacterized protein YdeI (YjbR/CyaY-like superfamily)
LDWNGQYLSFASRVEWRAWLQENHTRAKEALLIHYKKATGKQGLSVAEAVEEALCFGWIDGILRRIDAERHVVRYTPRRKGSVWSQVNKGRVERLIREGRMTAAGLAQVTLAKQNGQWQAAVQRGDVDTIPPDLQKALRKHRGMLKAFRELSRTRRKQYLWWIGAAKRKETWQKRVTALIEYLSGAGKALWDQSSTMPSSKRS